eukprot:7273612-Alexandrium_andersonii.AAC.1
MGKPINHAGTLTKSHDALQLLWARRNGNRVRRTPPMATWLLRRKRLHAKGFDNLAVNTASMCPNETWQSRAESATVNGERMRPMALAPAISHEI